MTTLALALLMIVSQPCGRTVRMNVRIEEAE